MGFIFSPPAAPKPPSVPPLVKADSPIHEEEKTRQRLRAAQSAGRTRTVHTSTDDDTPGVKNVGHHIATKTALGG